MTGFTKFLMAHLFGIALIVGMISFQLTKADQSDNPDVLMIEGLATSGKETDRSGERLNYPKSKPFFTRWMEAIRRATGGKSQGNIREQHDPLRAVGVVVDLIFDDVKQQIRIIAKIVDREAIQKILAGVYSALSIAGRYVSSWTADDGVTEYICDPSEISICDFPALPSATFEVISKSGTRERRHFQQGENEDMTRSDHQKIAARYLSQAEHHEALGKLCREGHAHHTQMAANGDTAPMAAAASAQMTKVYHDNDDRDPSGGLRGAVGH
jgi:hypothetical protein